MEKEVQKYYVSVNKDYLELKEEYPFSSLIIPPSEKPEIATVKVIAASKTIIRQTNAHEEDFKGEYSRELFIEVPFDYTEKGCKVYGAGWVDMSILDETEKHFDSEMIPGRGFLLCVGVPESFMSMKNVLLECVKTADMMLSAYQDRMLGQANQLELNAYSHGETGISEYQQSRRYYETKQEKQKKRWR